MNIREVIPLKQSLDFKLALPGSKSITNRAFLCAALAKGKSRLYGALESDDTAVMLKALRKLEVRSSKLKDCVEIEGCGGKFKKGKFTFDLHNAGTATRFLTAVMAAREGETVITGNKRMKERPIADLVGGLKQLGADISYLERNGCPPIRISGYSAPDTHYRVSARFQIPKEDNIVVRMRGDKSSQYFSALMMLGPLLPKPLKIEVEGELVSKPYIDITISVMEAFGVHVENNGYKSFRIKPQQYKATDYYIEGDASASSYWISMAYLHGGKVGFTNLPMPNMNKKFVHNDYLALGKGKISLLNKKSIQGDSEYAKILESQMSKVKGQRSIDMNDMPDVAMTLACTAPFMNKTTTITGLFTLRIKETDRLAALEKELGKIGVKVSTTKDSITIQGFRIQDFHHGGQAGFSRDTLNIQTYNDHRMAMCFAVIGTMIPGIVIENPDCVNKTYPKFWEDLERMYLSKKIHLDQKNLILTGMRCSGKTFLGKKIAKLLGRKFIDLDDEIEKSEGMKITEIVKKNGWDYFRKIEQKICTTHCQFSRLIIATGGGVVTNEKNMKALKKNGVNVFIFADPNVLIERIRKSGSRPALKTGDPVSELPSVWQERRGLYLKYADYVWDNTGGKVGENLEGVFV